MACAVGSRADTKKKKQTSRPVCCFPHYLTEEHSLTMLCQYSGKLTSVIEFLKTIWLLSARKSPKSKAQHFKKAQKTTKYLQDSFNNRREHFKPPNLPTRIHPRLHNSLALPVMQEVWATENMFGHPHFSNLRRFHKAIAAAWHCHGPAPTDITEHGHCHWERPVLPLEIQAPSRLYKHAGNFHPPLSVQGYLASMEHAETAFSTLSLSKGKNKKTSVLPWPFGRHLTKTVRQER